jgi:addiction module HigA family antidote
MIILTQNSITKGFAMAKQKVRLPGSVLIEKAAEYQITLSGLANELKLSVSAIRQVSIGKTKISLPVAFRLAKYFNTTVEFWVDLQFAYDVEELKKDSDFQDILKEIPKGKIKKTATPSDSSKSKKKETVDKKATRKEAKASKKGSAKEAKVKSPKKDTSIVKAAKEKPAKSSSYKSSSTPEKKRVGRPRLAPKEAVVSVPINVEKPKPKTILIKKNKTHSDSEPISSVENQNIVDTQNTDETQDLF